MLEQKVREANRGRSNIDLIWPSHPDDHEPEVWREELRESEYENLLKFITMSQAQ